MGAQPPRVVPPQLLGGQPAHALNESPLDLAQVYRRVQRLADVVEDVDPFDPILPGQRIDRHLGAGRAVAVVVERPAAPLGPVPVDLGRLVEACRGQGDPRHVGLLQQLGEGHLAVADPDPARQEDHLLPRHAPVLHREVDQPCLEGPRRGLGRHPVQVRARRGRRGRGVGDLAGGGRRDPHLLDVDLELLGHHLGDLDVEPLPHLGAAVVQVDAAVGVEVDQGAGLVEVGRGEGDAELDRGQRQAAHNHLGLGVGRTQRRTPRPVVGRGLQGLDDLQGDVVLDLLVVGRDVALGLAVEVALADVQRVLAGGEGDLLDQALAPEHALRPAEAAEGRVGDGVGLQRLRGQVHRRIEVAVVGVEQRPVGDRAREVGGPAAARGIGHLHRLDRARLVEAGLVVDQEVVALAGDDHVVVAVGPELRRPAGRLGDQGRDHGEEAALALLAAEGPTHAPDLDRDRARGHAQHLGHHVLDLAGMLGRGEDRDLVVLARQGHGDLALQVEVILAADRHAPGDAPRRPLERRRRITARQGQRIRDQRALGLSGLEGDHGVQRRGLHDGETGGPARLIPRLGRDREEGLAGEEQPVGREDRLVVAVGRADVVDARDVGRGEDRDHALGRPHRLEIEAGDAGMGLAAGPQTNVQQACGLAQVVDVGGRAGDVLVGAVVAPRLMHRTADPLGRPRVRHGPGSGRRPGGSRSRDRWSRCRGAAAGSWPPAGDSRRWPASP